MWWKRGEECCETGRGRGVLCEVLVTEKEDGVRRINSCDFGVNGAPLSETLKNSQKLIERK